MQEEATTTRTLRNIRKSLIAALSRKYKDEIGDDKENIRNIADEMLKIHGLHKDNFDFVNQLGTVINDNLGDVSIDENSNKNEKTVAGLIQEVVAPLKKAIGYDYLYRKVRDKFGKRIAKKVMGDIFDLSLGFSDSTATLIPYCWAFDASKIITIGRDFGQLKSKPAKRWSSYISALCETIHQLSSHVAGALTPSTIFIDIAHLGLYKMGITLDQLRNNTEIRKDLENEFQQFVHSVNHLSREAIQSPFVNVSAFDRPKIKAVLDKDNYGWYFPQDETITEDYVTNYILEVQRIFLNFFDKGDPNQNGAPYRFPIFTINISKDDKTGKIIDKDFLKEITKLDIYKYNIFTSSGSKLCSCCRLISNEELMQEFSASANSFGGGMMNLGSHRVCTINFNRIALEADSYKHFFDILEKRTEYAAMVLASHKELIKDFADNGLQQFISNGWINFDRLFSTFGILGIYEAKKTLENKFGSYKRDIIEESLTTLNELVSELSEKHKIIGNIEQIPAESFASRLAKSDKLIYGKKKVPFRIYSNQFIPLWEDATIWERMETDGKYNQLITGGGIVHAQIGEKVTSKQAEKLIDYAVNCGCEHFALNAVYTKFEDDTILLGKYDKSPDTGSKSKEYYTRVVGFFTPVSSWQTDRRDWEFDRRTFVDLEK